MNDRRLERMKYQAGGWHATRVVNGKFVVTEDTLLVDDVRKWATVASTLHPLHHISPSSTWRDSCRASTHALVRSAPYCLELVRAWRSLHFTDLRTIADQAENRTILSSPSQQPDGIQVDEYSAAWASVILGHSPAGQAQAVDPRLLPEIKRGHPGPPQIHQTSNTLYMPSLGGEYEW
jgi:hypothetical protein